MGCGVAVLKWSAIKRLVPEINSSKNHAFHFFNSIVLRCTYPLVCHVIQHLGVKFKTANTQYCGWIALSVKIASVCVRASLIPIAVLSAVLVLASSRHHWHQHLSWPRSSFSLPPGIETRELGHLFIILKTETWNPSFLSLLAFSLRFPSSFVRHRSLHNVQSSG